MLTLAAALSVLMGLSLGLLGGGGSILAVPILLYVVGVGAKEAIATSLLVVGATSLACVASHARGGHVRWRVGLTFGAFAMVGSAAGGAAAAWISGQVLLLLFAAMMVAAGVAMLRPRREAHGSGRGRRGSISLIALEGAVVGAVTGMVGAGGGFLVVPALLLLGGLSMRDAIGTSTLVIALKSFAGFAGHASHVAIDPAVAGLIIAFAIAGSFVGSRLGRRVDPSQLRALFATLVLVMAAVIAVQNLPPAWRHALLVERWPFWAGGAAIGGFVLLLLGVTGRTLGVSTGFSDACALPFDPEARRSWRLPFLVGIVAGGGVAALVAGALEPTAAMGLFDSALQLGTPAKAAVFLGGGVLLGFGARLAGGCTSGHGIAGVAQLAPASLLATAVFMASGMLVAHLLFTPVGS